MSIKAERLLIRAKKLVKKGDTNKAKEMYIDILNSFPNNLEAKKGIDSLEKNTHKLLNPTKALAIIKEKNINRETRVLNYCGGGIAATLNAFVLRQLGIENLEIYDNSMSEWAKDTSLPIETTE